MFLFLALCFLFLAMLHATRCIVLHVSRNPLSSPRSLVQVVHKLCSVLRYSCSRIHGPGHGVSMHMESTVYETNFSCVTFGWSVATQLLFNDDEERKSMCGGPWIFSYQAWSVWKGRLFVVKALQIPTAWIHREDEISSCSLCSSRTLTAHDFCAFLGPSSATVNPASIRSVVSITAFQLLFLYDLLATWRCCIHW